MQKEYNKYLSPLSGRCASVEMRYLSSPEEKFRTRRELWIVLAEAKKELGFPITEEQITELKAHAEDINYETAEARERGVRRDAMGHVYAYGRQCPSTKDITHFGATSCYVGDSTDIILMTEGLRIIRHKLLNTAAELANFAKKYKGLPTLAFVHSQLVQPAMVGKRATLWANELFLGLEDLDYVPTNMKLLGCRDTADTQASFKGLFKGDGGKIRKIGSMITKKMDFSAYASVSDQTYSQKTSTRVLNVLAGIVQNVHKLLSDARPLQRLKEVEGPFEESRVDSPAMAYKRNPMRYGRMVSLADYMISNVMNPMLVVSTRWFEYILDDSANKHLPVPEGFLAIDGILHLYMNAVDGFVAYLKAIERCLMTGLPFMATGNIMMDAVEANDGRQELREKIRELSIIAGQHVEAEGKDNDLLTLIAAEPSSHLNLADLEKTMQPERYIGRSAEQVTGYLNGVVNPLLKENQDVLGGKAEIQVQGAERERSLLYVS